VQCYVSVKVKLTERVPRRRPFVRKTLRAPFLLSKAAFPSMREAGGGTIVNVSSVVGKKGWAGASAYCASKFGLTGFTEALADEGKEHGIRAIVLYPRGVR
jgi:3-oxoacyl-[acyl-carrier protein] reductase